MPENQSFLYRYFDKKKTAAKKEQKTIDASAKVSHEYFTGIMTDFFKTLWDYMVFCVIDIAHNYSEVIMYTMALIQMCITYFIGIKISREKNQGDFERSGYSCYH